MQMRLSISPLHVDYIIDESCIFDHVKAKYIYIINKKCYLSETFLDEIGYINIMIVLFIFQIIVNNGYVCLHRCKI